MAGGGAKRLRLFLDLSVLVRWSGPPVGISRVEAGLARYALDHRPDVGFVVFDTRTNVFQGIRHRLVEDLVEGRLAVEMPGDARVVKRSRARVLLSKLDRPLYLFRRPR